MGFLDVFIIDTLAVDSGKAPGLCRDLMPGSRGATACARARGARAYILFFILFFKLINSLFLCLF